MKRPIKLIYHNEIRFLVLWRFSLFLISASRKFSFIDRCLLVTTCRKARGRYGSLHLRLLNLITFDDLDFRLARGCLCGLPTEATDWKSRAAHKFSGFIFHLFTFYLVVRQKKIFLDFISDIFLLDKSKHFVTKIFFLYKLILSKIFTLIRRFCWCLWK